MVHVSYESEDPELSVSAIKSYSCALQAFVNESVKGSGGDLARLIDAMQQMHPKITDLEIRRDAPLIFDSKGEAINPHRERQLFLLDRRNELQEELRRKQIVLSQIEAIAKQVKDPGVPPKVDPPL